MKKSLFWNISSIVLLIASFWSDPMVMLASLICFGFAEVLEKLEQFDYEEDEDEDE